MRRPPKPPLNLRMNRRSGRSVKSEGPVRLNEPACDPSSGAAKRADKLVSACRENVRFLNFHLQPFEKYLELPVLVDNALYLAYTIKVRDNAPISAFNLRKKLAKAGIETSPAYSFAALPEETYTGTAANRIAGQALLGKHDTQAFCLGCHQYLTILDLEHIVEVFESIFSGRATKGSSSSQDINLRDND